MPPDIHFRFFELWNGAFDDGARCFRGKNSYEIDLTLWTIETETTIHTGHESGCLVSILCEIYFAPFEVPSTQQLQKRSIEL